MNAMARDRRGPPWWTVVKTLVLTALILFLPVQAPGVPEMEISGFSVVQETGGTKWTIRARTATYRDEMEVILDAVTAEMASGGVREVSVTGDTGRYDAEKQILFLEGNVVARTVRGLHLRAETVRWNGTGAFLEAWGGVELTNGPILVRGGSARYTPGTGTALVMGKVMTILETGRISP